MQYSSAVINFMRYAQKFGVPESIFLYDPHVVQFVVVDWTIFSRSNDAGRTTNVANERLPITAARLTNRVSALGDFIRQYAGPLGPSLLSPELSAIFASLKREDEITRGPKDSWARLPLAAEFHVELFTLFRAHLDPSVVRLYTVAALFEYMFGTRVKESLVDTRLVIVPNLMPDIETAITDPRIVAAEASASVHTVKNRDVQLYWILEKPMRYAHEGSQFPPRCPDFVTCFQRHTKNWKSGPPPSSIWVNPAGEHAAPYCLVTELYLLVKNDRARAADGFLLLGAHDSVLRTYFKETARLVGFDQARTMLCGSRKGCASATTLSDSARIIAAKMRDQHQHWRSDQSGAYVYGDVADGLEKTIQLYDLRTCSIAQVNARFMRPFSIT